nr:unnamed protein product [Callosobruchus analis]
MWDRIKLLFLLQWKFWILRIRSPCGLVLDLLVLLATALMLCAERTHKGGVWKDKIIFEPFCASPKSIPYLCPINNTHLEIPINNPTRIIYSPENRELSKIMNIFTVFGYEVEPKQNHKILAIDFKMNADETLAGIEFDDSYSTTTDLRNMKNFKASIR